MRKQKYRIVMEAENILLFQPVRTIWHTLCTAREKPLIRVSSTDTAAKKNVIWLANSLKNRLTEVALTITTIFTFLYSLITYPIRWGIYSTLERRGIERDLIRFTPEEAKESEKVVNAYLEKHKADFAHLSTKEKEQIVRKIVSQCARSQKVYGPIVRNFVDYLLETASQNGQKLVFMARDGICFYKVAIELMKTDEYQKKYPKLTESIVFGHFSRKLVKNAAENPDIFKQYISEELHIKDNDRCIFVDIGFSGSMIKPIRKLLPEVQIDFKFLLATPNKEEGGSNLAEGFLGNPENPLPHVETAANNLGIRWVEESHHGTVASATKLVVGKDNRIYPDSFCPTAPKEEPTILPRFIKDLIRKFSPVEVAYYYKNKILYEKKFSTPHLLRKFCLKGLVHEAVTLPPLSKEEAAKGKELFNDTIGEIKAMRLPLLVGWDY